MPKLSAFKIDGLTLKFNSLDHMAEHFHVFSSDSSWEIRVFFLRCTEGFLDFEYKRPPNPPQGFVGITKGQKKELLIKVLEHRRALLLEWQEKVVVMENYNADDV